LSALVRAPTLSSTFTLLPMQSSEDTRANVDPRDSFLFVQWQLLDADRYVFCSILV
jgi:hypothetical protein